jgi:aminomethyltransferase
MSAEPQPGAQPLKRTPLYGLHVALGARMVPFAGYDMPVQYPAGVMKEHLLTRSAAGLFDVSHMGQVAIRPRNGKLADAALALERLVPADVAGLSADRQRYSYLTSETGGILDDLMIARRTDHLLLVVNASRKEADLAHLEASLGGACDVRMLDRALIALQGPKAEAALAPLAPACAGLSFMDVADLDILGARCTVVRSGYTGEDGFEISTPSDAARKIAEALLESPDVAPIGLGARDSLRLEAGLCLYGSDIDETTTPVEAALTWAIPKVRRTGGARAGGFPGAGAILDQLTCGVSRKRVGLRPEGRAPVRAGARLFAAETGEDEIGAVTSGGFGPSVEVPVAMGYAPHSLAVPGTRLFADVRGKRLPVTVADLPFIETRYKRGPAA